MWNVGRGGGRSPEGSARTADRGAPTGGGLTKGRHLAASAGGGGLLGCTCCSTRGSTSAACGTGGNQTPMTTRHYIIIIIYAHNILAKNKKSKPPLACNPPYETSRSLFGSTTVVRQLQNQTCSERCAGRPLHAKGGRRPAKTSLSALA